MKNVLFLNLALWLLRVRSYLEEEMEIQENSLVISNHDPVLFRETTV